MRSFNVISRKADRRQFVFSQWRSVLEYKQGNAKRPPGTYDVSRQILIVAGIR